MVDEASRLLTISGRGGEILEEADAATRRILSDPRIGADFRVLIVAHDSAPPPSPGDIPLLADLLVVLRKRTGGRIAIVTSSEVQSGPARVISLLGSQPMLGNREEVRTFASIDEGRTWLFEPAPM